MDWIVSNKEWIFSGIGVLFLSLFLVKQYIRKNKQIQKGGRGSTNIQAGNDIRIGHTNDNE